MKHVKIGGVKSLKFEECNEPVSVDGRVVMKVKKVGICGSDIHNWAAGAPEGLVMGHEFSGVVLDPGSRTDLKIGDRVTGIPLSPCGECEACKNHRPMICAHVAEHSVGNGLEDPGAMAEVVNCIPSMVKKLPDSVSDEQGAMVEPIAVCYHAANLAEIKKGAKVLVIGAGIIGLGTAMFAKKAGASLVVVSEANEKRGEKALALGVADKYLDAKDPEFVAKAMEVSEGGFDVVFDCVGIAPAINSGLFTAKGGATVVLVGVANKPEAILTIMVVSKELKMVGALAYSLEEFDEVINMIANNEIDVLKFVDDVVALEDTQKAFERLTSGNGTDIKILIDPAK